MRLSLRRRLFLAMVGVGTLPLAVALVVLALQVRSGSSPTGPRAALDEIAESGRALIETVDTAALAPAAREAMRAHAETIARRTTLARRAETITRAAAAVTGVVLLIVATVLIAASVGLVQRWSRYVSSPIEELVEWVRRIERREPLPADQEGRRAPEFDQLRSALRRMDAALTHARAQELEQERLRAFRETARKVAHEMRGPLTASRLALRRLAAGGPEAASVLEAETARLELMAQEFSDFGRLPEGPEAEVDLSELIDSAVTAAVPAERSVERRVVPGLSIRGHYEPLRRAVQNLLRNAVEASHDGLVEIEAGRQGGDVRLSIADHGPGIPEEDVPRIFEPYFTTKDRGTGLGLAMVRQTVLAHGGTIRAEGGPEGGTRFVITLPERG